MALKLSFFRIAILVWLLMCLAGQSSPSPQRNQTPNRVPTPEETAQPPVSEKQKRSILRSNFEKMRRDVDELAELTKQLQGDLDKSNENILSLGVIDKADKIEKLAKKIKGAARGT